MQLVIFRDQSSNQPTNITNIFRDVVQIILTSRAHWPIARLTLTSKIFGYRPVGPAILFNSNQQPKYECLQAMFHA